MQHHEAQETVGGMLRQTRFQLGYTLQDVTEQTKLTPQQVQAMELDRFDELPGGSYTLGYLRIYAQFLKLDLAYVLDRFALEQKGQHKNLNWFAAVVPVSHGGRPGRGIMLLCAMIYLLLWFGFYHATPEPAIYAPRLVVEEEGGVVISPAPGKVCYRDWWHGQGQQRCQVVASTEALSAAVPDAFVLEVQKDGWLSLQATHNDGVYWMDGFTKAGTRYLLPLQAGVQVTHMVADGLRLYHAGAIVSLPAPADGQGGYVWKVMLDELIPEPMPETEMPSVAVPASSNSAPAVKATPQVTPQVVPEPVRAPVQKPAPKTIQKPVSETAPETVPVAPNPPLTWLENQ